MLQAVKFTGYCLIRRSLLKTYAVVKRKSDTIQVCRDSNPDLCNAAIAL